MEKLRENSKVPIRSFRLFIDGKNHLTRGLDLAYNPFNGNVLGDVVLVAETLLNQEIDDGEDTVRLFPNKN